jgi:hypothetical protein
VGWLKGDDISEQIFILVMYTFGMGVYDIQLPSILCKYCFTPCRPFCHGMIDDAEGHL